MPRQLLGTAIAANTITTTQLTTTVVNQISAGGGPRVTSLIYPGNDTAGNTVGGQTVYINGSGFETNNAIYINGNAVPSKSFISASNLSFTTPALSAGIYPVYVINTDNGATAIFIPGYVSSAEPTWVTSAGSLSSSQDELSAWSYSLSATGDAPITYALAAGSSLPTGVSLAANGLISGTISSPSGNTTTYTFSVVATDAQNQDSTRQFTVTTSVGEGVLFANNVLLIHADGTNNGNNHAFVDSSNNNFTITRNGNSTQGTFSPFSQTGWSAYFDGTGDYLTTNNSNVNNFGTSDWTIEFWINSRQTSRSDPIGWNYSYASAGWAGLILNVSGSGSQMSWYEGTNQRIDATNTGWNNGAWNHIAITRSGNSIKMFLNGVQQGNTYITSLSYGANSSGFIIGINFDGNGAVTGYMSNLRILKGTALYTGAFSPSTTPLTAIANTSLLTCQSNRFIDNSTNAFTITRNGDTSIQAWSPFAPTAAYSTANVGGSAYFDGTGDYLSVADNAALQMGSGNFTIEYWWYPNNITGYQTPYDKGYTNAGGLVLQTGSGDGRIIVYASGTGVITSNTAVVPNSWTHMALVRNGTNLTLYQNGISVGSATNSTNFNDANTTGIGANIVGSTQYPINGYISNFRVVKGTAVYTSNFTPPTAPLTNIANTQLLCNFTNAQIFDQTAKNVLECVGDAKVSTAQYKYGTGSIAFDGTGDYLTIAANPLLAFGTGDFTVEFWFRSTDGDGNLIGITTNAAGNWNLVLASSSLYWQSQYAQTNLYNRSATGILDGNWHHIAITRASGTSRMFFDGTQQGVSVSDSTSYAAAHAMQIGSSGVYGDIAANIDDLRITKGYARYTSNFTPPSSAHKDK